MPNFRRAPVDYDDLWQAKDGFSGRKQILLDPNRILIMQLVSAARPVPPNSLA